MIASIIDYGNDDESWRLSTPTYTPTFFSPTVYVQDIAPVQGSVNEATVPIDDFQKLLQKLEASKMRQQRQQSVEGRRDIYSQGLASMMGNF